MVEHKIGKFELHDTVEIIDVGKGFSTYESWASLNGLKNFISGVWVNKGDVGVVTVCAQHSPEDTGYGTLYGVKINNQDYIMGESGLRLVQRPLKIISPSQLIAEIKEDIEASKPKAFYDVVKEFVAEYSKMSDICFIMDDSSSLTLNFDHYEFIGDEQRILRVIELLKELHG